MIGIVIVTYGQLGDAFIDAAEFIIGSQPDTVKSVSINFREGASKLRYQIANTIKKVDRGKGVLVLTDMITGSSADLSYSFLEKGKVEIIFGVNLPILIKVLNVQEEVELSELAESLEAFGKISVALASGILKGNKRR